MEYRPLIQEEIMARPARAEDNAWRMMCTCILLNQTRGKQVRPAIRWLFAEAGSPAGMVLATADGPHSAAVARVLRPLGLQNRRAVLLNRFSRAWLELGGDRDISVGSPVDEAIHSAPWRRTMPGVGRYASDAWTVFVRRQLPISEPPRLDKELERLEVECFGILGTDTMGDEDFSEALSWRARNLIGAPA